MPSKRTDTQVQTLSGLVRAQGPASLWTAIIGALLALGLTLPALSALDVGGIGTAIWTCVLVSLCCAVMGIGGVFRWIGLAAMGGSILVLGIASGVLGNLGGLFSAVVEIVRGNLEPIRGYGNEIAMLLSLGLTLGGWAMAKQSAGFYPALSMTLIALLLIWFSNSRDAVWFFAPALIALCALFSRLAGEETPVSRVLLVSTLVVSVGLAAAPALSFQSTTLESLADRLRTFITDTLFFSETRTVYTIYADGYKPLETRLGGPVYPDSRPVMTVETPKTVLLRGTIYNNYNGLNWTDTLSVRRFLFMDPRNASLRSDILDEARPSEAMRYSSLFKPIDIGITMQSDSASTLFLPQRPSNLQTPMDLVPYFNQGSELFITRDLEAGDSYSVSAPVISLKDSSLPAMLAQAAAETTESRDMSAYLHVPDAVADQVYTLVAEITRSGQTPFEKAQLLMAYLQVTYRYTLRPDNPPANQDFVSYFLLTGKEGYCTYFASAMAIMGRIAGLPTRYVEGYLVEPVDGLALITSKQAHAWTEVYFEGFGWIPFDATPTQGRGGPRADDDSIHDQKEDDIAETPGQEDPDSPDTQNTPAPEPQGDGGDSEPEQVPGGDADPEDDPTPTPSPPPQDDPTDTPQDEPEPDVTIQPDQKSPSRWWIWLLVLAAIALLTWRGIWTRPETVAGKQTEENARLLVWYRALLGLLASAGMPAKPFESPQAYAFRVEKGIPKEAGFLAVADSVTRLGYGHHGADPADTAQAAACYKAVWHAVPLPARGKWLIKRMLRGIGSIQQVP